MQHTRFNPTDEAVDVREVKQRDGFFTVTLPVSSDQLARDGEAFDTDRLRAFREQINSDRTIPVFLSHGKSKLTETRYGTLGKVGRVRNADLETREGATLLVADLEVADPDELAEAGDTGDVEEALRWVRQQFRLGLGAVSVGWQEDPGDREVPGDAELLEVSIVGLSSDTSAEQAAAEPSEAAVRGFDALPADRTSSRSSDPMGWYETTDGEAADRALDTLADFHDEIAPTAPRGKTQMTPHDLREHTTSPVAATVEELLRQFGHGRVSVNTGERLEELRDDERAREGLQSRLETIAEHRAETPPSTRTHRGPPVGRGPPTDDVVDAVETLERLLTDADTEPTGAPDWRA